MAGYILKVKDKYTTTINTDLHVCKRGDKREHVLTYMISCSWVDYFVIYDVGLILSNLYTRKSNVEEKFCILTKKSAKALCKTDL